MRVSEKDAHFFLKQLLDKPKAFVVHNAIKNFNKFSYIYLARRQISNYYLLNELNDSFIHYIHN